MFSAFRLIMAVRVHIQVCGIVQGVGFRPFVYALASEHGLSGRVSNNEAGVSIDIQGSSAAIESFVSDLQGKAPALAQIESLQVSASLPLRSYKGFNIDQSTATGPKSVSISPDVSICDDCLRELFDPNDRRFRYPFINCTNCGPRFTIVEDVPYDRDRTTMREFQMCVDCRAEYQNPLDRRFHAEPIACGKCGPSLLLHRPQSSDKVSGDETVIARAGELLMQGKILGVKGIGGYHLVCDATNEAAVSELRRRKYREDKPFALMTKDLKVIRNYCALNDVEEQLLVGPSRPIVLLKRLDQSPMLPEAVAPHAHWLGFMLPYTPLHFLLLERFETPLVMTSGNVSDEPICYQDDEARARLAQIADYFLTHDRRIHMRMDDSVVRAQTMVRRSRGYSPAPLNTGFRFKCQILACGAELKNTFCLTRDNHAFVSHHIGDLENFETLQSFTAGIEHYQRIFYLTPEVVAYDLHPEYLSTKYALGLDWIENKFAIQHHHAHIASCMADNHIEGEVIGVAMDGLGFGTDGRMWGGEFLIANFAEAERCAHLEYQPLPGGTTAIREPWRMAAVYLQNTMGDDFLKLDLPFVADLDHKAWQALKKMIATRMNCPETSSMGRLFDAVSSLLRLRDNTNYEGQAAIELEQITAPGNHGKYELELSDDGSIIRAQNVIRRAVEDLLNNVPPSIISARFHFGVADVIARVSVRLRHDRNINRVVLSGGVFQNQVLLEAACAMLTAAGFEVFTHHRVPTNDGGISLGQAAIANALLR